MTVRRVISASSSNDATLLCSTRGLGDARAWTEVAKKHAIMTTMAESRKLDSIILMDSSVDWIGGLAFSVDNNCILLVGCILGADGFSAFSEL